MIKVIVEKKSEERICFVCNERKAVFEPDGKGGEKYNFVPHIIDRELKIVCMYCKMELLRARRQRNGF